jgi:hypothetical protein
MIIHQIRVELRKRFFIGELVGLTISKDPSSTEMVIHVQNAEDLRIKSSK